jgi:hypothetical protein
MNAKNGVSKRLPTALLVGVIAATLVLLSCGPSTPSAPPPTAIPTELPTTEPPTAEPPTAEPPPSGILVTYQGISFYYDPSIASGVTPEIVPQEELMGGGEYMPEHVGFFFDGYVLQNTFHEPRIHVYAVADLIAGSASSETTVNNLRQFLTERPADPASIPLLPLFNAAQLMRAQISYLDFQNGSGVRFLSEYAQYFAPIANSDLFYTFQGLTSDGTYYVAAILPASNPILQADTTQIPGGDFDAFSATYDTYIADIVQQLNAQTPASFTPDLSLLDAMIQSLTVTPGP